MKTITQDVPVKPVATSRLPMTRFMNPFEEFDGWLEGLFPRAFARPLSERLAFPTQAFGGRTPYVDVVDRDTDVFVKAEMPGVEKKDVEISATDNTLSIKATTATEEKEETGDYYRSEIVRGEYFRTIALPGEVDGSRATATLKNGILEVSLPKIEKAKRQKIALK